jgi:small basic protein
MIGEIETILYAISAGIVYGLIVYARKYHETFDPAKFFSTIFVSALVGIVIVFGGHEIGEESFMVQWTALAGLVVIVENIIKAAITGNISSARRVLLKELDKTIKNCGIVIENDEWEKILKSLDDDAPEIPA